MVFVYWDMTPCILIKKYRGFRSILVPHIQRVEECHKRINSLFEYFTAVVHVTFRTALPWVYVRRNATATNEENNPTFNKTDEDKGLPQQAWTGPRGSR